MDDCPPEEFPAPPSIEAGDTEPHAAFLALPQLPNNLSPEILEWPPPGREILEPHNLVTDDDDTSNSQSTEVLLTNRDDDYTQDIDFEKEGVPLAEIWANEGPHLVNALMRTVIYCGAGAATLVQIWWALAGVACEGLCQFGLWACKRNQRPHRHSYTMLHRRSIASPVGDSRVLRRYYYCPVKGGRKYQWIAKRRKLD